jgi:cohesin loading factor subunit SCC2
MLDDHSFENTVQDTADDLGGYGSEDDVPLVSMILSRALLVGMSEVGIFFLSCERSNDDNFQGPLEKLTSLIEDIFEAEDALPADIDINELNHDFFSPLSTDYTRPLLSPSIVFLKRSFSLFCVSTN